MEIIVAIASPLLVFLATLIGLYFTSRKEHKGQEIDEVKFVVEENRIARVEIKQELEQSRRREENCQKILAGYRDAVVEIRRNREKSREHGN